MQRLQTSDSLGTAEQTLTLRLELPRVMQIREFYLPHSCMLFLDYPYPFLVRVNHWFLNHPYPFHVSAIGLLNNTTPYL